MHIHIPFECFSKFRIDLAHTEHILICSLPKSWERLMQDNLLVGTSQAFGPPYKWLGDCPKVIDATRRAYPSSKNSFRRAAEAIVCLCAATAQPTCARLAADWPPLRACAFSRSYLLRSTPGIAGRRLPTIASKWRLQVCGETSLSEVQVLLSAPWTYSYHKVHR
jgi:hypothetical protein